MENILAWTTLKMHTFLVLSQLVLKGRAKTLSHIAQLLSLAE